MDISEPDLLFALEGGVAAALGVVRVLCEQLNFGLVDETGEWRGLPKTALDELCALAPEIRDEELAGLVASLCAVLQRVPDLVTARPLVEIAASLHLPPPAEAKDYRRLARKRRQYDTVGPMWLWRPGFQRLLDDMLGVCAEAERTNRRIAARLARLTPAEHAEYLPVPALVASAQFAVSHLHQRHSILAVDITGRWQAMTLEIVEETQGLARQIDDAELRELVEALGPPLRTMLDVRDRTLADMARLGLPPHEADGRGMEPRLEQYERVREAWAQEPQVWQAYNDGLGAVRALEETGGRIDVRLGELQAATHPGPWLASDR